MNKDKHDSNFIPIAEEFISTGRLDEAIELLKEGITAYPDYLRARVSLGKAYIAKGMIDEAMLEFEHVVRVSPDNLLAQRKLAVLYKETGRVDSAIKSCESILTFSSKDRATSDMLRDLNQASTSDVPVAPVIDFTSGWAVASDESKHDSLSDEFLTESMGDICIAQGEKTKGMEIFRKILQKDPNNESVRDKLIYLGGISDTNENTFPIKGKYEQVLRGVGGAGTGQSAAEDAVTASTVDSETEKREQQTERLGDFLNKVKINRR